MRPLHTNPIRLPRASLRVPTISLLLGSLLLFAVLCCVQLNASAEGRPLLDRHDPAIESPYNTGFLSAAARGVSNVAAECIEDLTGLLCPSFEQNLVLEGEAPPQE